MRSTGWYAARLIDIRQMACRLRAFLRMQAWQFKCGVSHMAYPMLSIIVDILVLRLSCVEADGDHHHL